MSPEHLEHQTEKQKTIRRFRKLLLAEKIISVSFYFLAIVTFSRFGDSIPVALFAIIIVGYFSCRMVTQTTKEVLHAQQRLIATIVQGEAYEAYEDWRVENPNTRDKARGKKLLKKLIRATRKEHQLREMEDAHGLIFTLRTQLATL